MDWSTNCVSQTLMMKQNWTRGKIICKIPANLKLKVVTAVE